MAELSNDQTLTSTTAESSSAQEPQQQTCAQCNKSEGPAKPLKECNKCHSVLYCGKDCQKAHFKTHKKVCASLAQEYVKEHPPTMASRAPPKANDRNTGYKKWEFDT
ncbi:hypothetical protein GQ43DRAFT_485170 [Delitschia confertaspora ATCC 74209]|uniref:MYND-type domain-containing protein n=1 Tax=Delitschia confertaspora ATCC 74209 TaxID=1513339 RepID=A0A9P4JGN3_9PLEO|nr:hypothetical protein GQ43DRAFT_485170 [Delitschia confertaspora ATCC 74209]